jgi:hypothetical protein
MTPAEQTLPAGEGHREDFRREEGFARRTIDLFRATGKPFVVCLDAGELYTPLAQFFENAGVPVFRRADEAARFLRAYVGHELRRMG